MSSRHHKRKAFFDLHANTWDVICNHGEAKLEEFFKVLSLKKGDRVLDVGTGTGILVPHILMRIWSEGSIFALDYSENMIENAKEKFPQKEYPNVNFVIANFFEVASKDPYDSIICYSCFPHLEDKEQFFQKSFDLLNWTGTLLIAHSSSRAGINEMHARKNEAVRDDFLPSLEEIKAMSRQCGFVVLAEKDDKRMFYVLMKKQKN